ncbi:MAG: hypothetical protein JNJ88_16860, partial [Planctomycetes bacterium]|nr:hypothetical protein [Planctomycetota bacterium]MBL8695766.1 hypothetical protein [Planctomycetota bacterium]
MEVPVPNDAFDRFVVEQFPFPIARAYALALRAEESASSRFVNLVVAYVQAVRIPALLLVSEYLA